MSGESKQDSKQDMETPVENATEQAAETLAEENAEVTIETVQADLEAALVAKADAEDQKIRAHAEMENIRKRAEREIDKARKFAVEKFANEMLTVLDSLEMGVQAADQESATVASLKEGSQLTLKTFLNSLEKFGVKTLNPEGEPFNPELHEAMVMQPSPDVEPNTVLTVVQKGYSLNERVMRPARVIVSAKA